jgi:hypothetical protein
LISPESAPEERFDMPKMVKKSDLPEKKCVRPAGFFSPGDESGRKPGATLNSVRIAVGVRKLPESKGLCR